MTLVDPPINGLLIESRRDSTLCETGMLRASHICRPCDGHPMTKRNPMNMASPDPESGTDRAIPKEALPLSFRYPAGVTPITADPLDLGGMKALATAMGAVGLTGTVALIEAVLSDWRGDWKQAEADAARWVANACEHHSLVDDGGVTVIVISSVAETPSPEPHDETARRAAFLTDLAMAPGLRFRLPGIARMACRLLHRCGINDRGHGVARTYSRAMTGELWSWFIDAAEVFSLRCRGGSIPWYLEDIFETADHFKGRFCEEPFKNFQVDPQGDVLICCPMYLNMPIGNAAQSDKEAILNGPKALAVRQSILDGDYRYCARSRCPMIREGKLIRHEDVTDPAYRTAIDANDPVAPRARHVVMSYDSTCNLSCPSCRTHVMAEKGETRDWKMRMTDKVVLPLLRDAEWVTMSGFGDIFTSRICRHVLQNLNPADYPSLKVHFLTNGVLLTETAWRELSQMNGMIRKIQISVDAAKESTSRNVRRGGDFYRLSQNLEFIASLRRSGDLDFFGLLFVYQECNFMEMKPFVEWCLRLGCDDVGFIQLFDWNTYAPGEYLERAVHNHGHPRHVEFLRMIEDPIFTHPIVTMRPMAAAEGR